MLRQTKQASSQQVQQRQPLTMNQSPPSLSYNRNSYDIPSVLRHHLQPGPVISEFPRPDGKRYSTNNDGPTNKRGKKKKVEGEGQWVKTIYHK